MKRISTIFIGILYFTFSTGVVIQHHFCGGKLEAISLYTVKACCADADSEKSCCHNSASITKVKDGYDALNYSLNILRHGIFVIADLSFLDPVSHSPKTDFVSNNFDKFAGVSPPIYLSNRVFII